MATPETTRFALGFVSNTLGPVYQGNYVTPKIINGDGTYTNAPALEQDAAYPMANLLTADRYLKWKSSNTPPSGNNAVKIDIDLGADRSIWFVSAHGIIVPDVLEGAVARPFYMRAGYRTAALGYDGAGTFTTFGADADFGAVRDAKIDNGVAVSFRYLRLMFSDAVSSPFSIGRLYVGTPDIDTGKVYSGASDEYIHGVLRSENAALGPTSTYMGEDHRELSLQFDTILDADIANLDKVMRTHQSFIYFGFNGDVLECIIKDIRARKIHTFRPPNIFSVTLDLLQLG